MLRSQRLIGGLLVLGLAGIWTAAVRTQQRPAASEWRYFGGDKGHTRYSALDQINRDNVGKLKVLWRRPALEPRLAQAFPDLSPSAYFRPTPIVVGRRPVLPECRRAGRSVRRHDRQDGVGTGARQSGVAGCCRAEHAGRGCGAPRIDQRLAFARGEYLFVLNAKTGRPYRDFGDNGRVNLHRDGEYAGSFRWTGGPTVVGDVIVVSGNGGGAGELGIRKEAVPEDVRGYDVRTGKLLWTFHVVPRPGEFGADTWGGDAFKYSGDMGAYGAVTADEELGYVYIPLSGRLKRLRRLPSWPESVREQPGVPRRQDGQARLALSDGAPRHLGLRQRKRAGARRHHGQWPAYQGRDAAQQDGFLYVFDRVTGEPVWPIEELPVPKSTVPGEQTWPTQPFPTQATGFRSSGADGGRPDRLHAGAAGRSDHGGEQYVIGPMYTPPSLVTEEPGGKKGTYVNPGTWGASNWHTGSFDPETGIFYTVSITIPYLADLVKASDPKATMPYHIRQTAGEHAAGSARTAGSSGAWTAAPGARSDRTQRMRELIVLKACHSPSRPYGRITAIDVNRGEHAWMVPNGDGPRHHPRLKHLNLPPLGTAGRPAPLVTKTLLFLGEGSDAIPGLPKDGWGKQFRAYDKATGKVLWEIELPAGTTGGPMTYSANGKQYIVVTIGGKTRRPSGWRSGSRSAVVPLDGPTRVRPSGHEGVP